MSIRELVEATMEDVSNYRYPNTSEFRTVINPILKAAGAGELLDSDQIDAIDMDEDALNISFSYSRMQCEMSGDRHLPLLVLDAADPIAEATAWRLDQAVLAAEKAHTDAVRLMGRATLSLEKAKADRGDAATVPDSGRDAALADVIRKYWAGDCFKGISKSEAVEIERALAAHPALSSDAALVAALKDIAESCNCCGDRSDLSQIAQDALDAHPAPSSDAKPLAYLVYGIGAGKHYVKTAKLIKDDDWKTDDDGLGEYWAGNELLILAAHPSNGAQAVDALNTIVPDWPFCNPGCDYEDPHGGMHDGRSKSCMCEAAKASIARQSAAPQKKEG